MIYSLRRRHFLTWIIIGLILPGLFLLAWNEVPAAGNKIGTNQLNTTLSKNIDVSKIREGTNNFLVLKLGRSLERPSILAYVGRSASALVSESLLLGRIEGSGTYKFQASENLIKEGSHLLLYDPIHKEIVYSIPI